MPQPPGADAAAPPRQRPPPRAGPSRAAPGLRSAPLRAGGGRAGGSARPRLGPAPRCPAPPGASCWRRAAPGRAAAGPREAPFASAEREVRHGRVVRGRAGRDHGSRASVTASIRAARGQRARRDPAASGAGRQGGRAGGPSPSRSGVKQTRRRVRVAGFGDGFLFRNLLLQVAK